MSADMAHELKPEGVTVVTLWPGVTKTELAAELAAKGVLSKLTGLSEV